MSSNSKQTTTKRANRDQRQGRVRKRQLRSKGSTPAFPLDPPK